jgi:hypothetical protein
VRKAHLLANLNADFRKRFLDDRSGKLKLARMKNLKKLGVLVAMCGMLGSCGIPMATVRTAQNTARTVVSAAGYNP